MLGSKLHSQDKVTARSPPQDQRRCWEQQKHTTKTVDFWMAPSEIQREGRQESRRWPLPQCNSGQGVL